MNVAYIPNISCGWVCVAYQKLGWRIEFNEFYEFGESNELGLVDWQIKSATANSPRRRGVIRCQPSFQTSQVGETHQGWPETL